VTEAATPPPALESDPEAYAPTVSGFYQRAGGIVTPLITAIFAFLMGGLVVAATGHNPLAVYRAIFNGAGLNWFFQFGNHHIDIPFTNHHVWFWWNTDTNKTAAFNITQTLITTAPLVLTGLAVAFAFRCGMFNIGGQGQYMVGAIVSVYVGSRFVDMAHIPHVLLAIVLAALEGDRRST
jgi:general nucleoside transport system permease protein